MRSPIKNLPLAVVIYAGISYATPAFSLNQLSGYGLEEVIVTAQKREQSLQDTPIAISVLTEKQLLQQGINSIDDLMAGTIPSLNINPFADSSSTLVIAIRGNGPGDIAAPSRDTSVAVYLDEIYLGRAQGLDFELAELERIEVLRGPQGTLYGRNATAGAINLISKRPSGEFGIRQSIKLGNYDLKTSTTHLDLPKWAGISSKIDYLNSERDGWVDNTAPGQSDYNEFDKRGLRISADISPSDNLTIGYTYNDSDTETTQVYFQFYRDFGGSFGDEGPRQSRTRFPVEPVTPTRTEQDIHSLSINWKLSETLDFTSLTSYRDLDDKTRGYWAGSAYANGLIDEIDVEQEQFAQEFRLLGSHNRLEWIAGIYYYDERTDELFRQLYSLDIFGFTGRDPLSPIIPVTRIDPYTGLPSPIRIVDTELESIAVYGQATWTPPILNDRLEITAGIRQTREDKTGKRVSSGNTPFDASPGDQTDPAITFNYHWTDNISTYAKWSTAYRSGGINSRSLELKPFSREEVESVELGMKMQGWSNKLTLNTTIFKTDFDNMFVDIFDPADFSVGDTINAADTVTVEGAEIDLAVTPLRSLIIGLSYTYLNGKMSPQQNPLAGNAVEEFLITQTPQHAGSLTLDYELPRFSFGTLSGHMDIVSSADYNHWASGGEGHPDGYLLVNARVELADIPLSRDYGRLNFAIWGKNITDEEYVISAFSLGDFGINHAFGEPRTAGVEVKYEY